MSMEEKGDKSGNSEEDPFYALDAVSEREMEIDSTEEDDDNIGGGEYTPRFDAEMNPLDFMNNDALEVQPFQQDSHLKYEVLAEKKRKSLLDHECEVQRKKLRQEDEYGASFQKVMEAMNYGRRRKSREPKKRGRRKGSRKKLSPEVTRKLGDATLHYAHGRYAEAIILLNEVILVAPHLPDPFHTLGLVYKALGENKKAFNCYMFAAKLTPKDSSLWKVLVTWSLEQEGNNDLAMYCLNKAIIADPKDITLRYHYASLFMEAGNYKKATESYDEIIKLGPENAEAYKTAANLHRICGQVERSISILEDYIKDHVSEADLSVVDLLASMCMKNSEHNRALQYIEQAQLLSCSGEEFPLHLTNKAGICHVHLGNTENAEAIFRVFELENASDHVDLITEVAESYMSVSHYESALKYYLKLQENAGHDNGNLHLKIAQCYSSLNERVQAIQFFFKALCTLPNNVDARLSLASLLLEDDKEDEVISLLSPPTNIESAAETCSDQSKPWWLSGKVKLMLSNIYRAKGMPKEFIDAIFPLIRESLFIESINQKIKAKKRLPNSVLQERVKILHSPQTDNVFQVRPIGKSSQLSKASRAKRLLQKREILKDERKAAALAAGIDWHSDESDDEFPREVKREPPLPKFLKNEEHHQLIIDLCKALASLQRYWEALEIINLTLRLAQRILSVENKEELQCLGAQVEYNITDSRHGYDYLRYIIQQRPYSIAAWNCYYKAIAGLDNQCSKHSKFLRGMRNQHKDCIPPIIISGHHHTFDRRHQSAARDYLYAYKLLPESPLINLCVGTSFINLALSSRLLNKHICVAQGLAFLYNNLRLCGNSQEALYNIARGYHHVGLFSLAASHYEKVLATPEKDYPIPELPKENNNSTKNLTPGYCNIRREAAYNLHLIYKNSGAIDLARQVLKDHCTL